MWGSLFKRTKKERVLKVSTIQVGGVGGVWPEAWLSAWTPALSALPGRGGLDFLALGKNGSQPNSVSFSWDQKP